MQGAPCACLSPSQGVTAPGGQKNPRHTHKMKEGHPPLPDREHAVAWIREQMETYGLSVEDLQTHGCFDAPPPPAGPMYMSADGQHWDGNGDMPDWLQRAVNAGQSIEHFRIG